MAASFQPPIDYLDVSVLPGALVSADQLALARQRYAWARDFCRDADVLELACGPGLGWTTLRPVARSLLLADVSTPMVERARRVADAGAVLRMDAQRLALPDASRDVVLLFEAIYYLPDISAFAGEVARVLRPGGTLLIATSNPDLFDFHPSPHSHGYLGVVGLRSALEQAGLKDMRAWGSAPVASGLRGFLRLVKWAVAGSGFMPGSMRAKQWLRRLVQGKLQPMPSDLQVDAAPPLPAPAALRVDRAAKGHRILLVAATRC